MKRILLILLLLSFTFSSCGKYIPPAMKENTTPSVVSTTLASTLSYIDSADIVQILPEEYMSAKPLNPDYISPDGKTIVLEIANSIVLEEPVPNFPTVKIHSQTQTFEFSIPLDIYPYVYSFSSWSLDGSAFAGFYYDRKSFSNGAEGCCGEALAITNLNGGNTQTFLYHWDWNQSPSVHWSPDSEKIILDFPFEGKTLIISKDGKLLQQLDLETKVLFWAKDFLITIRKTNNLNDPVKLQLLNLDTQNQETIFEYLGFRSFIGYNEKVNQLLLAELKDESNNFTSIHYDFFILDIDTKSIEKIEMPDSRKIRLMRKVSSPTQDFVALQGEDNSLWIFNWGSHEIEYYGQIEDLFGWYKNTDGFLVISINGEQKIINP